MTSFGNIAKVQSSTESLTSQNILELYVATLAELQNCASVKPAANASRLPSEKTEETLLFLEADLLNAAADIPLNGYEDLQNLIKVWTKASYNDDSECMRPSDKIAMNIFRHILAEKEPTR